MKKLFIVIIALVMLLPTLFTPSIKTVEAETTPIAAIVTESMKRQYIIGSSEQSTLIRNFLNNNTVDRVRFSFFNGDELLYYFEFVATQSIVNGVEYDVIKYDGSLFGNYWFELNTYQETGLVYAYSKTGENFSNQNLTRVDLLLNNEYLISNLRFMVQILGTVVNNQTFDYIIPNIIDQSLLTLENQSITTSAYYPVNYVVNLPTTLTREGHTFTGWVNAATGEPVTTPFVMPGENVNLVATFSVNTYQLSFITNGATAIAPLSVNYGSNITLPAPTREGYTFGGWYSNSALTNAFTTNTMPAENLTVHAKWIVNEVEEPTDPEEPGGPTDPTDPEEPGGPTDPEEPGNNNNNNNTGGGFWEDVGSFFKKLGNGIGKGAKSFADFWKTDAGKWTAIAIGSVIVIAGVIGIAIWAIPAIGAAGGFFPAVAAAFKVVGTKVILPALKVIGTKVVLPALKLLVTKILPLALPYIVIGGALYLIVGKPIIDLYNEIKQWINDNLVDPLGNTGIPRWILWTFIITIVLAVFGAINRFVKKLLGFSQPKLKIVQQKQLTKKPKKKIKKGRRK